MDPTAQPARYDGIAALLDYPDPGFPERVAALVAGELRTWPAAERAVRCFLQHAPTDSLDAMEELHTRTFDVQAAATLDLGYVLFGDDYKRGEQE